MSEYPGARKIQEHLQILYHCTHADILTGYEHFVKSKLKMYLILIEFAFK